MSLPRYGEYKDSGSNGVGPVPSHWSVPPLYLRYLADLGKMLDTSRITGESLHRYLRNVDVQWGRINFEDLPQLDIAPTEIDRYTVRAGDLLVCEGGEVGRAAVVEEVDTPTAFQKALHRLRPIHAKEVSKYMFYVLRWAADAGIFATNGQSTIAHLTGEQLRKCRFPCPPCSEQAAIAAFLDRETAKIDALVAEQAKLITLLAEKRQATIAHAVTRGLGPNAPMKDSGVAWLGKIPAHWQVKQLKHVARPGTAITYGIVQAGPHYEDGIPYIKTSDMAGDQLPLDGYALTSPEIDASYSRSKVAAGDIVVAIRATVGKCLPVPSELAGANLTQGTAKVSPGAAVTTAFLLSSLRSIATQTYFDSMAKGATFKEITLDALRRTPVLVPPPEEQRDIETFVDAETSKLTKLQSAAESAIALLHERRSALIAAAVTGQIDVRNT